MLRISVGWLSGPNAQKHFEVGNMHTGRLFGTRLTDITTKRI